MRHRSKRSGLMLELLEELGNPSTVAKRARELEGGICALQWYSDAKPDTDALCSRSSFMRQFGKDAYSEGYVTMLEWLKGEDFETAETGKHNA